MCSIFVYKVLMNTPVNELFQYESARYTTSSSSSRNLLIPFVRASRLKNSICYLVQSIEALPERVKYVRSYTSFKRQQKKVLISQFRGESLNFLICSQLTKNIIKNQYLGRLYVQLSLHM